MKTYSHPLPHFNERPEGQAIDTIVIHSMYCPGAEKPFDPALCIKSLDEFMVSAHYAISQEGEVWKLVDEEKRAWHAGKSKLPFKNDSRENVNHFSIGIELLGDEGAFTEAQYQSLANLTVEIAGRHPITGIVGHDDIAPDRKVDPPPSFEWDKYRALCVAQSEKFKTMRFSPRIAHKS